MRYSLLTLLIACGSQATNPPAPPAPSDTTALVFMTDYGNNFQVNAVDVATRASGTLLPADELGSNDALIRTFGDKLYVVGRDFQKDKNNVTVLSLQDGYAPGCSGGGSCQFGLGNGFNAYDFWAVSSTKAYITSQPSPFSPDEPQYQLRHLLTVVNPDNGTTIKTIDVKAGMEAIGVDLSSEDTDDYYGLASLWANDKHLFVSIQMLAGFDVIDRNDACGAVASRVAVIDLDTDQVVKVLKLKGSNVSGKFVVEEGTDNILIPTTGSQNMAAIGPCDGIERINTKTLALGTQLINEATIGGNVMSFAYGKDGKGIAFVGTGGTFTEPLYEVRAFDAAGVVGEPLFAPGAGAVTQPGFVVANDRGEVYVGLPLAGESKLQIRSLATGTLLDELTLANKPIDIALFPGVPYSR